MKKYKSLILIFCILIMIFTITGCSKPDNSLADIKELSFEIKIDNTIERFVIAKNENYKEKYIDGKLDDKEFFFWDDVKKKVISDDLKEVGFFGIDGYHEKNNLVRNGINFTMKAKLTNGETIEASGKCATPNNYHDIVKVLKLHFY